MADGRNPESICADCSTPNPTWASLNRGVLVCDDCCGVHRSLGRHISYIKSLHTTNWSPAVREMVSSLVRKGANAIWEHALHDPSSSKVKIRKPGSREKVHPTKHDFIVAKYKHLALLPRMSLKETTNMVEDLSKQLHASVRTSNLETCLRLLSMGADPNYLHPDRGNTPLHVAAHANQSMQVELLVIHGANPTALDLLGHTSEECARIAGHHQLANRLIESQYELTDRLSYFLCGRKPLHDSGEHYLIPQGADLSDGISEAKNKLQQLTNDVFEELATDIFDEVDRRETDAIWLTTQLLQDSVAFLPVNPALSPMRNQGRQKLATLDGKVFTQLVMDVLLDTKRRQNLSLETGHRSGNVVPTSGNLLPEHDYDDVALEEEESNEGQVTMRQRSNLTPPVESTYSIIGEDQIILTETDEHYSHLRERSEHKTRETEGKGGEDPIGYSSLSSPSKSNSAPDSNYSTLSDMDRPVIKLSQRDKPPKCPDRPKTTYDRVKGRSSLSADEETVSRKKFDIIMEQLRKVQKEKEELQVSNQQLNQKLNDIQRQLNKVVTENVELRSSATPEPTTPKTPLSPLDSPVPPSFPSSVSPSQPTNTVLPPPPSINPANPSVDSDNIYSAINKKPKPIPPVKKPLSKTWSTPTNKRNPTSPLPPSTTPPIPKGSPIKKPSLGSIESTSPNEGTATICEEDSTFIEEYGEDSAQSPPPIPSHRDDSSKPVSPPKPPVMSPKPPVMSPKPPVMSPKPSITSPRSLPSSVSSELPPMDQVHQEIKAITLCIQELLKAGQTHKQKEFQTCSTNITTAVDKLINMFPLKPASQTVDNSIQELSRASSNLANECQNPTQIDQPHHTRLVMNGAYDVAKAARFLVTCVEGAQ